MLLLLMMFCFVAVDDVSVDVAAVVVSVCHLVVLDFAGVMFSMLFVVFST